MQAALLKNPLEERLTPLDFKDSGWAQTEQK